MSGIQKNEHCASGVGEKGGRGVKSLGLWGERFPVFVVSFSSYYIEVRTEPECIRGIGADCAVDFAMCIIRRRS